MLMLEKKILQWAEKHMCHLAILLACGIALYLRRGAIWWNSPDVGFCFDRHPNHIQSSLYYVLVLLMQYLPLLPLHSMKWLCILADCGVILFCALGMGGSWKKPALKDSIFLIIIILSPAAYLRGAVWAQPDSVAFCLLLAAYLLWSRGWRKCALIPAVAGAAIYPCFLLLIVGYLWFSGCGGNGRAWIYFAAVLAGLLLILGLSAVAIGETWQEGIHSCIRWMAFDPYEGILYKQDGLAWLLQIVNVCGYGAAIVSLLLARRGKISWTVVLLTHMATLMVYGRLLFPAAA